MKKNAESTKPLILPRGFTNYSSDKRADNNDLDNQTQILDQTEIDSILQEIQKIEAVEAATKKTKQLHSAAAHSTNNVAEVKAKTAPLAKPTKPAIPVVKPPVPMVKAVTAAVKPVAHKITTEANHTKKLSGKSKFIAAKDIAREKHFSPTQLIIMVFIATLAIVGLAYSFTSRAKIRLTAPMATLNAEEVIFQWESKKEGIPFMVEVYDENELIIRQLTQGTSYTPTLAQKSSLQANHNYQWRVISYTDRSASPLQLFTIDKAITLPSSPLSQSVVAPPTIPPATLSTSTTTEPTPESLHDKPVNNPLNDAKELRELP